MKETDSTAAVRRAEYDAWCDEQIRLGLEDLDAGGVVSDEELERHFEQRFRKHAKRRDVRGLGLLALDLLPPTRSFVARRMLFGARAW